jgi:hypothetical protein
VNDVFISYARSDRPVAQRLADVLQARGLSVWWDRELAPGQRFAQVIGEELGSARCVLVLWSRASVGSHWVSDEAAEGQRRGVLVPALIEAGLQPPLGFRGLHTAEVFDWVQGRPCAEFERLCRAVQELVAPGPRPAPPPPPPPSPPPSPPAPPPGPPPPAPPPQPPAAVPLWKRPWAWASAGSLLVLGALFEQMDYPGEAPPAPPVLMQALQMNLQWRDEVLGYSGQVDWDGITGYAQLSARITDLPSGRTLGQRTVEASVQQASPGQLVLTALFPVPGDSQNPGPHEHMVNLQFQHGLQGWTFLRNCAPGPGPQPRCW